MSGGRTCAANAGWPLERVLFAMAGTITLLASLLAAFVSPWFLLLIGFVAINQLLYVRFAACGASIILSRLFGLKSALYPATEESISR